MKQNKLTVNGMWLNQPAFNLNIRRGATLPPSLEDQPIIYIYIYIMYIYNIYIIYIYIIYNIYRCAPYLCWCVGGPGTGSSPHHNIRPSVWYGNTLHGVTVGHPPLLSTL